MARSDQVETRMRIVIAQPVVGVAHSLQSGDGDPLDPKRSLGGEGLTFDFTVRVAPGPRFFGKQVHREGPTRRFIYVRIGQMAGDHASPWSRRMKIDIHDLDEGLLAQAAAGGVIVITVRGTARDGTPACATLPAIGREFVLD